MANKTIGMIRLKQLFKLKAEGKSIRAIAPLLKVNRETVARYINQAKQLGLDFTVIEKMNEEELQVLFSKVNAYKPVDTLKKETLLKWFPYLQKELARTGVDRWVIYQEYITEHPDGYCYNHFCREYKTWAKTQDVSAIIEHKVGEKLYVDFAGKKLQITDRSTGEIKKVEVFVAILGFSQFTYVQACPSQKREVFIGAVENTLHYIGGVPEVIVSDNLKSAVFKAHRYEPQLNEAFERFALHYSTVIVPARPKKPKDKPRVEGAVKIVYSRIYALIRNQVFFSIEELNETIFKLLVLYNEQIPKHHSSSRRSLLDQIEKNHLKSLPAEKHELCEYLWTKVYKTAHIMLPQDKHYYSVPYELIGKRVKMVYNSETVEIYYNFKRVAMHKRNHNGKGKTTVKEHLPLNLQFTESINADMLINWAASIGCSTKQVIEKIISERPHFEQSSRSCLGILSMAKKVGKERLEKACLRALYFGNYGYRTIKNILQKNLDMQPLPKEFEFEYLIGEHENIRGSSYYN